MQRFICGTCSNEMQVNIDDKKIICPFCNKIERIEENEKNEYMNSFKTEIIDNIIIMNYKDVKKMLKSIW